MPEFAFLDQHNTQVHLSYGGGGGGRGVSPDSVIYSVESSLRLFSSSASASASASIARCSSASDVPDHVSFGSDMSLHLSGGFRGSSSARSSNPDADPNKNATVRNNGGPCPIGKKVEKAEAIQGFTDAETNGRSTFSHTIKEPQQRKSRSEILLRKSDRRRPASLDLNNQTMNASSCSPRLRTAMTSSVSAHRSGVFPSPGTPNYRATIGVQKGWSSERVPSHTNTNRFTLNPYNNGRTLPSKWEDAERWIISPVALKPSIQQPQRRNKSKSGPLGPPGSAACYSMYSPVIPSLERENVTSLLTESPLLNRVNPDNNSSILHQDGLERSVSVHGCSQLLNQSLLQVTQDDKMGGLKDARDISRKDMATQMSPESSTYSSSSMDPHHARSSKADIRDVQVDGQVTLTRWSKKNKTRIPGRWSEFLDARSADWEASEMTKSLSKVKREEAKITAWENLQKAKAEAAIRKLEMKLEKKRLSSMDSIMSKLRTAQKKAQEMRESVLSNQSYQVARSSYKVFSLIKTRHILSGCFTYPTF